MSVQAPELPTLPAPAEATDSSTSDDSFCVTTDLSANAFAFLTNPSPKYHPVDVLADLREAVEALPPTRATFGIPDLDVSFTSQGQVVRPEMILLIGSWPLPGGYVQSQRAQYINPNYIHKQTYSDFTHGRDLETGGSVSGSTRAYSLSDWQARWRLLWSTGRLNIGNEYLRSRLTVGNRAIRNYCHRLGVAPDTLQYIARHDLGQIARTLTMGADADYSVATLARAVGISRRSLSRYRTGQTPLPSTEAIEALTPMPESRDNLADDWQPLIHPSGLASTFTTNSPETTTQEVSSDD